MVYNSNPVVVCPDQDRLIAGLSREDLFTVVSEQFLTDTADYADIVLPATTQLEQDDIMFSWGHLYITSTTRPSSRSARLCPTPSCSGASRPGWGSTTRVQAHRRGDDRRGVRMVAPEHGRHHPRLTQARRAGSGSTCPPDDYAPHAEGNFPTASGKVEFAASAASGRQLRGPAVPPGLQRIPARRPRRPAAALHAAPRDRGLRSATRSTCSPPSRTPTSTPARRPAAHRRVQGERRHHHPTTRRNAASPTATPSASSTTAGVHGAGQDRHRPRRGDVAGRRLAQALQGHATVAAVNPFVFGDLGNAPTFSDTKVEIEPAEASDN